MVAAHRSHSQQSATQFISNTSCFGWGTTYLQQYVIVSAKEEGDRVAPFTRAVCRTVQRTLENVICTVYMDVVIVISQRRRDALVHLANWSPKLLAFFRTDV